MILCGCGHGGSATSLLPSSSAPLAAQRTTRATLSASAVDVVAINAAGPASGMFVADTDVAGGQVSATGAAIDTNATNAAPAAIYQTQRYGPMTYTIPGLTPGAAYTVRLHFAEIYFGIAGRPGIGARQFTIVIGGTTVASNFDILAKAGAPNKAFVQDFSASANAAGQIVLSLTNGNANLPALNGLEIRSSAAPPPGITSINVGGGALAGFVADTDGVGGIVASTSDAIDVSARNAATAAVYQTQRYGPMTYAVPGFTAGAAAIVRLHFSEQYWGADGHPGGVGSRRFNVAINGAPAATNLDVYAAAGGANKALVIDTPADADAKGTFTIALTKGAADNPVLDGIQIVAATKLADVSAVNVGGGAVGIFGADSVPSGGSNGTITTSSATIDVSAANAAPQFIYQSQRYGPMQRAIGGLTAGAAYIVRLHFAELYYGLNGRAGNGARLFNVALNGTSVAQGFDVFAAAGAANKAVVRDFPVNADANGNITVTLTNGARDNAMLSGIEILGTVAANATPPPIAVGSESPRPADAFVDTIGVNVHLSEFGTLYGDNFGAIRSLLQNAGIRHVRDGTPAGNASLCAEEATLAPAGVHMNVLTDGNAADLATGIACLGPTVETIEGANEADLNDGANWVAWLTANTQAIATQFPAIPIVAPAVTTIAAETSLGSLANTITFGNAHLYFAGRNPGTNGWGGSTPYGTYGSIAYNLNVAGVVSSPKPIDVTETGYSESVDQYALPAVTKARYTVRTLLEAFNAGVPRVYVYELVDEGSPPFSHYGMVDGAGNPKPVYTAVAKTIQMLADPGAAFAVSALHYNLAAAASVHHTLLQRHDGTFALIVWNEVPEWNPNANAMLATAAQPVELTFATPPTAIRQTTFADDGTTNSAPVASAQVVSLSAGNWPTIIEITP